MIMETQSVEGLNGVEGTSVGDCATGKELEEQLRVAS
jgi:hypothetical protein